MLPLHFKIFLDKKRGILKFENDILTSPIKWVIWRVEISMSKDCPIHFEPDLLWFCLKSYLLRFWTHRHSDNAPHTSDESTMHKMGSIGKINNTFPTFGLLQPRSKFFVQIFLLLVFFTSVIALAGTTPTCKQRKPKDLTQITH